MNIQSEYPSLEQLKEIVRRIPHKAQEWRLRLPSETPRYTWEGGSPYDIAHVQELVFKSKLVRNEFGQTETWWSCCPGVWIVA